MNNYLLIIDSLKRIFYLSKSCEQNYRNIVRGFGRFFFIFKEFNMNEIAKLGIKVLLYRNVNNNIF